MKKVVLALLLTVLCLGATCALALQEGNFYYDVENGAAVITSYIDENEGKKVVVPDELGGYPVGAIGYDAFSGHNYIESITLPATLTEIGWYAFSGCDSLKEIAIPYGVTSIGKLAFANCSALRSVTLPDSLRLLSGEAFVGCDALEIIAIPAGVERISSFTFQGCTQLKRVTINGMNTEVYPYALLNEYSLATDLPSGCVVTCWEGSTAAQRALESGLTVSYFALPPAETAPVVTVSNVASVEELVQSISLPDVAGIEQELPVLIVLESEKAVARDMQGNVYEGVVHIERYVEEKAANSVTYEVSPVDELGNTLASWEGAAGLLLPYPPGLNRQNAAERSVSVIHGAKSGDEVFSVADGTALLADQGILIEVSSLSPFTVTWEENDVSGLPDTGDDSLPLALLAFMAIASAGMVVRMRRRRA